MERSYVGILRELAIVANSIPKKKQIVIASRGRASVSKELLRREF